MKGKKQRLKLAFACLPTVAHFYLPPLLDAFAKANPKIKVRMQGQPAGRIIKLVMAGEVEFDVTLTAVQPWNLEYTPISREPYNQSLVLQGTAVTVLPSLTAQITKGNFVALPFSDVEMYRTLGHMPFQVHSSEAVSRLPSR